jgi:hypothetical protein
MFGQRGARLPALSTPRRLLSAMAGSLSTLSGILWRSKLEARGLRDPHATAHATHTHTQRTHTHRNPLKLNVRRRAGMGLRASSTFSTCALPTSCSSICCSLVCFQPDVFRCPIQKPLVSIALRGSSLGSADEAANKHGIPPSLKLMRMCISTETPGSFPTLFLS